ncbi:protein prenyltransferase alpha subunit repeat-containing protein 1 [Coccinella septempunctata]|uniref:protein prenyltransferase alpha subunit repeat-containing protein 1 n=1 Tax=Coccinella septempunctata TaxID=41139 RepID=UPI001D0892E7|nr:protein prenyltransferase alpha subunit repeat-containing protein 1 [Coccinella septempunctata]
MGENSAMCEKVLRTLENIIQRDSEIREFAIVQTTENLKNKSPILYEENCLGLESWCKPYLQSYSHSVLLKNRKKLSRKQMTLDDMKNLNHVLVGGLLVQPTVVTFWNMKRDLVENDILNIEQELYFNEILLSMYPKSYEAFSYRKWLLSCKLKKVENLNFFQNESKVCERTAVKSPNNYHSWNYRIWCMEILLRSHPEIANIVLLELKFSIDWITNHISEYTGYNYRQFLIRNMKNIESISYTIFESLSFNNAIKYLNLPFYSDDPYHIVRALFGKSVSHTENDAYPKYINLLSVLLNDLFYISVELNYLYSNHECLWSYRKFLIIKLIELIYDYHEMKLDFKLYIEHKCMGRHVSCNMLSLEINELIAMKPELPNKITSSSFYNLLLKKEIEFLEASKHTSNASDINLSKRHLKWLKLANIYN